MNQVHIIIKGTVQGVGFRYFTAMTAANHHINGWVRNLENGDVEICAQGGEVELQTFIEKVKIGPRFSNVTSLQIKESTLEHYDTFKIK